MPNRKEGIPWDCRPFAVASDLRQCYANSVEWTRPQEQKNGPRAGFISATVGGSNVADNLVFCGEGS